ncbi:hypothetical protein EDF31_105326 [Curtobacterium sp. PhB142]|uniref:hypothetical protein n=1 Tax=unclassified Curtobacterium TaxID=257496 RepID=UPI0010446258|nr:MULTISPECIES: hypothetical protein [unclassified Curtobacterium]TCL85308.1 hypothetical protein EDF31_105326 [Curtobacterium sp. PhB142]TCM01761.1 hypothetical protein EDF26_10526 [Curtobacterium sp. PhB134]TDW42383.1 hypothetical protein EDF52_11576 [Curtobacterium sp. PhB42]TDW52909.1 hypothetical protein EDF47_11276 [Curtobacterium sp. PhB190]
MTPKLHCVPPGEYSIANIDQRKSDGRSFPWDFAKPVREICDPVRPFTASEKKRVDEISFRASAGMGWVRTARGELTPSG